jgi:hypothetical protein
LFRMGHIWQTKQISLIRIKQRFSVLFANDNYKGEKMKRIICEHGIYTPGRCRKVAKYDTPIPIKALQVGAKGYRSVIVAYNHIYLCEEHKGMGK